MSRPKTPLVERFWPKVDKSGECWLWTACTTTDGYPTIDGRGGHRIAWEFENGPIPPGRVIDHICHNIKCVRASHLRAVTQKQNMENLVGAHNNSRTGIRGVGWHKHSGRWQARLSHHGRAISVGYFTDLAEAEAAVIAKRNELFTHNDTDRNGRAA